MRYHLCDFTIESDIRLPCTPFEDGVHGKANWDFELRHPRSQSDVSKIWRRHQHLPNGDPWILSARTTDGVLLRFPSLADFMVSTDFEKIDCFPCNGVDPATIEHLLLDQVIPVLLSHKGELILHAGGVTSDLGAVIFLGESGLGKSTLCSSFNQAGFPLLGDDFLLLRSEEEKIIVIPSYPGLRLWPDSRAALNWTAADTKPMAHYTTKERLNPSSQRLAYHPDPAPVTTLFVLAPLDERTEEIVIEPMPPRDAFLALVNCTFRLDVSDKRRNQESFRQIGDAVARLNVCSLSYPRQMSRLPEVRDEILSYLADRQKTSDPRLNTDNARPE